MCRNYFVNWRINDNAQMNARETKYYDYIATHEINHQQYDDPWAEATESTNDVIMFVLGISGVIEADINAAPSLEPLVAESMENPCDSTRYIKFEDPGRDWRSKWTDVEQRKSKLEEDKQKLQAYVRTLKKTFASFRDGEWNYESDIALLIHKSMIEIALIEDHLAHHKNILANTESTGWRNFSKEIAEARKWDDWYNETRQ